MDAEGEAPRTACAFVVGATGYTGTAVVRELADRHVETIAHIRPDSQALEAWRARHATQSVVRVDLTPWIADAMTATLTLLAPTLVFALLGTTRTRGRRAARDGGAPETYETIDYDLTLLLLRAAVAAGRVTGVWPRFVYLSSVGASPDSRSAYLAVRGRIEGELRGSGLAYVIARPSLITGPDRSERRPAEHAAALGVDTALVLAGALGAHRLQAKYGSITGRQLARALVVLALDPGQSGTVADSADLRRVSKV